MTQSSFWKGKRVLITGHTGFKGAWLSRMLAMAGAEVTGFALAPEGSTHLHGLLQNEKHIQHNEGDIRNLEAVLGVVQKAKPDVVLHLAAQSLVRRSYRQPVETYATNVMGTVHVLEAIRQRGANVASVVVVSSDKCYENREWVWGYREDDQMGGFDPYSNSKGCTELVTASYRNSFFSVPSSATQVASAPNSATRVASEKSSATRVASARAGNVIGGGDWAEDRLVPDAIRAFTSRTTLQIRNPAAIRPWQHVLEPLSGYLLLAERLSGSQGQNFCSGWNFGPLPSSARPVGDVIASIANRWGADAKWEVTSSVSNPHEAHYLKLDISKAIQDLRWNPKLNFEQTMEWTAAWYKLVSLDPSRAVVETENQIRSFQKL